MEMGEELNEGRGGADFFLARKKTGNGMEWRLPAPPLRFPWSAPKGDGRGCARGPEEEQVRAATSLDEQN